jgi:hypothetical protein
MKILCEFAKEARHREGSYDLGFILRSTYHITEFVKSLYMRSVLGLTGNERKSWSEFFITFPLTL